MVIRDFKLEGPQADKYPEFRYFEPILQETTTIFSVDPERLTADSPYPRSVNPPEMPVLQKRSVLPYEVVIHDADRGGRREVRLNLLPSEHSLSRYKRTVVVFEDRLLGIDNLVELAQVRAFRR